MIMRPAQPLLTFRGRWYTQDGTFYARDVTGCYHVHADHEAEARALGFTPDGGEDPAATVEDASQSAGIDPDPKLTSDIVQTLPNPGESL